MSNNLDPDQARHFVGPDLGPNCLQLISADNKVHYNSFKLDQIRLFGFQSHLFMKIYTQNKECKRPDLLSGGKGRA